MGSLQFLIIFSLKLILNCYWFEELLFYSSFHFEINFRSFWLTYVINIMYLYIRYMVYFYLFTWCSCVCIYMYIIEYIYIEKQLSTFSFYCSYLKLVTLLHVQTEFRNKNLFRKSYSRRCNLFFQFFMHFLYTFRKSKLQPKEMNKK